MGKEDKGDINILNDQQRVFGSHSLTGREEIMEIKG
jgi:hypothetical protein